MKRRHSAQTRDAALRRLGRANRWLIAGSLALTAVLAEVAAQAFPGKSLHGTFTRGTTGPSANPRGSGTGSANSVELHPPAQAPESAPEEESDRSEQPAPPAESSSQEPAGRAQPSEQQPAPAQQQPQRSESSPPVVSGGS